MQVLLSGLLWIEEGRIIFRADIFKETSSLPCMFDCHSFKVGFWELPGWLVLVSLSWRGTRTPAFAGREVLLFPLLFVYQYSLKILLKILPLLKTWKLLIDNGTNHSFELGNWKIKFPLVVHSYRSPWLIIFDCPINTFCECGLLRVCAGFSIKT